MIIAVDFDGTINSAEWPALGNPLPFVADTLRKLRRDGHYIVIWTCREGKEQTDAVNWLLEHDIPFDRINDHHPVNIAKYGGNARKVFADLYIDDRQLGGLPDWETIYDLINKQPH
jgi:Predicted hydrolases of the HAD superfamily